MINEVLAFDIETIPDVGLGRKLYELGDDLPAADVVRAMEQIHMQKTGGRAFLPLFLHQVVCISVVYRSDSSLAVKSLENPDSSEADILNSFYDGLERLRTAPQLVSWNGNGFDLPVMNYRAMRHGLSAPRFWETGDGNRDFRYNNYHNRYLGRHLDLMDLLSRYQMRSAVSLNDCSAMLGHPGKLGMSGADVWPAYQEGKLVKIREYCEVDALNTYLVYLRFEVFRGRLTIGEFRQLCDQLQACLEEEGHAHFQEFIEAWDRSEEPAESQ